MNLYVATAVSIDIKIREFRQIFGTWSQLLKIGATEAKFTAFENLESFELPLLSRVTRISTFVEILKILFKIFSNTNPLDYILLHYFVIFCLNFDFSYNFFHIFIEKFHNFLKNNLVTLHLTFQKLLQFPKK